MIELLRPAHAGVVQPPLATYRFQLTRDDVAAFERLPSELIGREKLFLLGPALLAGMALGVFEDELRVLWPGLYALAEGGTTALLAILLLVPLSYLVSSLLLSLRTWWRIRDAKLPVTETVVETLGNCFAVTQDSDTRGYRWDEVEVIGGDAHVFLCPAPRRAIILPLRAFADEAEMRAFARLAELAGLDPADADDTDDNLGD